MIEFVRPELDMHQAYAGSYNMVLVSLSILLAVLGSYLALHMSENILSGKRFRYRLLWISFGALAMGTGVWGMHFVGMLAFSLPCGISYEPLETAISMLPGIFASAVALWFISTHKVRTGRLLVGGVLVGSGIGAMHYLGMAAMRMDAHIYYDPTYFTLSIVFAVVLAILSLNIKFALKKFLTDMPSWELSLISALFMGGAISGMHYIAMRAAVFMPADATSQTLGVSPSYLAIGIVILAILVAALAVSMVFLGRNIEIVDELRHEIKRRRELSKELEFQKFTLDEHAIVSFGDSTGRITYVNDKFCSTCGFERENLIGQPHAILNSDFMPRAFYQTIVDSMHQGEVWHGEIQQVGGTGFIYWVDSTIVPFLNEDGKLSHFVSVSTDITARKIGEKNLLEAKEKAEAASRAKSTFLSSMSHELRTPLNGILGFAQMLKMNKSGHLDEKELDWNDQVIVAGTHLLDLINDVLEFAMVEDGNIKYEPEEFLARDVFKECFNIVKPLAAQKNITLQGKSEVSQKIYVDRSKLKQVLLNLLGNAIKYGREGGYVHFGCKPEGESKVALFVEDNGIGIPQDEIPFVFEAFQRGNDVEALIEGTGVGLSVVKKYVELMDGEILVESEHGKGTTFTLILDTGKMST